MSGKGKTVVESYLQRAEESLEMAKAGADIQNHFAAYHLSLTFELVIKAVRLHHGLPATANHLVFKLLEGLESTEPWTSRVKALEELEKYSTAYRYPSAGGRSAASPPWTTSGPTSKNSVR
ncbi:MAG: HEPN domain-containing protein [Polyangiaceae bacterium]